MGNSGSGGYVHHTVVYYNVEEELEEEEISIYFDRRSKDSGLDGIKDINNILEQVSTS